MDRIRLAHLIDIYTNEKIIYVLQELGVIEPRDTEYNTRANELLCEIVEEINSLSPPT